MPEVQFGVQYNAGSMAAAIEPLEFARRMEALDPIVLLTALAQHTEPVRLDTDIAVLPFRSPGRMAKVATSINALRRLGALLGTYEEFAAEGMGDFRRTSTVSRLDSGSRRQAGDRLAPSNPSSKGC